MTRDQRGTRPGDPVQPFRRAVLLLLDGAHPAVFRRLLEAGDLPAISRHVLESGGLVPVTTAFPSTTGVAYLPLLTGCYPGTCGVPGIRWMDPSRYGGRWWRDRRHVRSYCGYQAGRLDDDLTPGIRSLFDLEPDALALCSPFTRGLPGSRQRTRAARALFGAAAHYTGRYAILDRHVGRDLVASVPERPRLTFAVFPAVDGITHFHRPDHPEVLDVYRQFDRIVGRWVAAGGLEGDPLVAIVSDHGAMPVRHHEDLGDALERFGLPTLHHPTLWRRDPRVAVMVSGNASAHVYLRPGVRRDERFGLDALEAGDVPGIPPDLVPYLVGLEGVGLVAGTEGSDVVVVSRAGRARLRPTTGGRIRYVPETADVLGLAPRARELTARRWLEESFAGPYPDSPEQLTQLFRTRRTGDLVVSAAPGADLRDRWELPEHRSGHGGLVGEHMRCLLAVNRELSGPLRTVDVFALVAHHLGHAAPAGIDGDLPEDVREEAA